MPGQGSLGRIGILGPEDIETGLKKLDIIQAAMAAFHGSGLRLPAMADTGYEDDIRNLINLDDAQLGSLLNKVSENCGFIEGELAKAESSRNGALNSYEYIRARVNLMIKESLTEKVSVGDKNDMVITDPRVVDAKAEYEYREAIVQLTKAVLHHAQRQWDTVSRRITQRGQDIERMRRETNVAGIPTGAFNLRRNR